jgi:hypothetical protein
MNPNPRMSQYEEMQRIQSDARSGALLNEEGKQRTRLQARVGPTRTEVKGRDELSSSLRDRDKSVSSTSIRNKSVPSTSGRVPTNVTLHTPQPSRSTPRGHEDEYPMFGNHGFSLHNDSIIMTERYKQSGNQPGGPSSKSTRGHPAEERHDISDISNMTREFSNQNVKQRKFRKIEPKLADDKSNLVEWYVSMEVALQLDGLYHRVLDEVNPCSKYDDLSAWHMIYQSVGNNVQQEIAFHAQSAGATLRSLHAIYGTNDRWLATRSFSLKFDKLKQRNFASPLDLYQASVRLNNEAKWLRIQGIMVTSESDIAKQLIVALGDEYQITFRKYFDTHDDVQHPFVLCDLKRLMDFHLETAEAMRGGDDGKPAAYSTVTSTTTYSKTAPSNCTQSTWDAFLAFTAFNAVNASPTAAPPYSSDKAKKKFKLKPKRHCTHCNKPGHLEDECWQKYPEKKRSFLARRSPDDDDVTSAMNAVCMMAAQPDPSLDVSDMEDDDSIYDIDDLDFCEWPDECKCWRPTCLPSLPALLADTTSNNDPIIVETVVSAVSFPLETSQTAPLDIEDSSCTQQIR